MNDVNLRLAYAEQALRRSASDGPVMVLDEHQPFSKLDCILNLRRGTFTMVGRVRNPTFEGLEDVADSEWSPVDPLMAEIDPTRYKYIPGYGYKAIPGSKGGWVNPRTTYHPNPQPGFAKSTHRVDARKILGDLSDLFGLSGPEEAERLLDETIIGAPILYEDPDKGTFEFKSKPEIRGEVRSDGKDMVAIFDGEVVFDTTFKTWMRPKSGHAEIRHLKVEGLRTTVSQKVTLRKVEAYQPPVEYPKRPARR